MRALIAVGLLAIVACGDDRSSAARPRSELVIPPPRAGTSPTRWPADAYPVDPRLAQAITKLDETRFRIKRALIDTLLQRPAPAVRSARVVPSIKDGKPNGFKLYAIRPASIYARVGLQNGDTIHAVNGRRLDDLEDVLEVYQRVRDAPRLELKMTRRGQPVTLVYELE